MGEYCYSHSVQVLSRNCPVCTTNCCKFSNVKSASFKSERKCNKKYPSFIRRCVVRSPLLCRVCRGGLRMLTSLFVYVLYAGLVFGWGAICERFRWRSLFLCAQSDDDDAQNRFFLLHYRISCIQNIYNNNPPTMFFCV